MGDASPTIGFELRGSGNQPMNAYLILDLSITNVDGFMEYVNRIPEHIEKHHGRYVVQGVAPTVMEGGWKPDRVVVLEFPSREHAENFLDDPEARELFAIRHSTTNSKLILVDGCL